MAGALFDICNLEPNKTTGTFFVQITFLIRTCEKTTQPKYEKPMTRKIFSLYSLSLSLFHIGLLAHTLFWDDVVSGNEKKNL